jgi:outer membrane lipoprotein-sorting protein
MTRAWVRWVPAIAVPAVIVAGALAAPLAAGAAASLTVKTPQQLLAMVENSSVDALSGTVEQTSNLGLPELPTSGLGSGGSGSGSTDSAVTSALAFLTGTQTARVYLDGPKNARVQILDPLAESDAVRHGNTVWLYSSKNNTATKVTLPSELPKSGAGSAVPGAGLETPGSIAKQVLAAVEPSTKVSVPTSTRVAGRSAYELVLTPVASDTLVGSVTIAVDAKTGFPLSVDVQARNQSKPAFEIAFTSISFTAPDASLFSFTPPKGATVKHESFPTHASVNSRRPMAHKPADMHSLPQSQKPIVVGTGWDAIIELPATAVPSSFSSSPLVGELSQAVNGGRVLSTSLLNVLLTTDGRVLIGSVSVDKLQAAAASQ